MLKATRAVSQVLRTAASKLRSKPGVELERSTGEFGRCPMTTLPPGNHRLRTAVGMDNTKATRS
jgi:hypothetical protein